MKHNLDASVFYLEPNPSGRLLEIGCGNGESLDFMQRMGWHATGLDFDAKAVAVARSKGLDVRLGQLKSQDFDDESFDAIVTRHVIEHLPAPQAFLETCWRILKKGGTMMALTPNADSRLHHRYGQHWIGLEPPRHLQLFTVRSLGTLAERSGFVDVKNVYIDERLCFPKPGIRRTLLRVKARDGRACRAASSHPLPHHGDGLGLGTWLGW